jgi:hypothetical protein
MGVGIMPEGRVESLKSASAYDNPILPFLVGRKRLNAEAGNQRVERRDGSATSRISEANSMHVFEHWKNKNIDRYSCDQGPNLVFGELQH